MEIIDKLNKVLAHSQHYKDESRKFVLTTVSVG